MLIIASAATAVAVLTVVALVLRYRLASYSSLVYVDAAEAARLREARRASNRTAA